MFMLASKPLSDVKYKGSHQAWKSADMWIEKAISADMRPRPRGTAPSGDTHAQ